MPEPVLSFTNRGIYCSVGDFYIDPNRPVDRALITHGHADHARSGHKSYLCSEACAPVLKLRLGKISVETLRYGEQRKIGSALVSFHPAGHLPGSAQIRVEVGGEIWVASGDYKVADDGFSEAFEPVRCHSFITECTFGLPVFQWEDQAKVARSINDWWAQNKDRGTTSILAAYSLGKAQRVLAMLNPDIGPILTHSAVENTNSVLRRQGYQLPDTVPISPDAQSNDHQGAMVIAPPSTLGAAWVEQFGNSSTAFASGWMCMRSVRRRGTTDIGFIVSDHADWCGLTQAIKETNAENIYTTHGYKETFARWLNSQGYNAQVVPTKFDRETGEPVPS